MNAQHAHLALRAKASSPLMFRFMCAPASLPAAPSLCDAPFSASSLSSCKSQNALKYIHRALTHEGQW